MEIPPELQSMLNAEHGPTKQKAARLVVDLAASAGASQFTRCAHAHVSGVSVITGGHGLRRFLSDLSGCLLYTSPSPRDYAASRMPSSA